MMKTILTKLTWATLTGLFAMGLAIGNGAQAQEKEPSAFELIKEGNKHVGEDARDRVVQIRSEKSIGSLTPSIWYIVYYDPDATAKATEVKFGAGRKLTVKRPSRVLEPIFGDHKQLDREKLKVDSNDAIKTATSEPLLKNLNLTATQLWLQRHGGDDAPVWKVRLWAAKLRNAEKSVEIGDIYVSAEDGKVVKNDLHINRVD